jgi:hypothetical protein
VGEWQPLDKQQAFLALPSFYEKFHDDFFVYHSSTIAEYLNNIRWSIYRYLQAEFSRSYCPSPPGDFRYKFSYPENCQQTLARSMYWALMNHMRQRPYFPEFSVSQSFKKEPMTNEECNKRGFSHNAQE